MIESVPYAPRTFVSPVTFVIHQSALTVDAALILAIIQCTILQLLRNASDSLRSFIQVFKGLQTSLFLGLLQEEVDVVNTQWRQSLIWSFKIQQEPSK